MSSDPLRIFIIGCPRSGTTLLQSVLAAHSQVVSVPETHFWPTIMRKRRFWRFAGAVSPNARDNALRKLREIGLDEIEPVWPDTLRLGRLAGAFLAAMDARAARENAGAWIEKTPRHLHYVSQIRKSTPQARFLHMLRPGHQVIASMREVTKNHPQTWGGERDVLNCIDRWIGDIRISLNLLDQPNHDVVYYDDLVADPESEIMRLCSLLGLTWEPGMVERRQVSYGSIREPENTWTDSVTNRIASGGDRKFNEILTDPEKAQIRNALQKEGLWGDGLRRRLERHLGC